MPREAPSCGDRTREGGRAGDRTRAGSVDGERAEGVLADRGLHGVSALCHPSSRWLWMNVQ
jgi:hypothetical protein